MKKHTKELENVMNSFKPTTQQNLFRNDDIIALGKFWIERHENYHEYLEEYNHGVIDGVEYMLYLLERCGD